MSGSYSENEERNLAVVRQFFGDSLQKEYIRRPAFSRLAINPLRDFRQRPRVGINPYVELLRMLAGRSIHESTVAGPDIDCDSAGIRRN